MLSAIRNEWRSLFVQLGPAHGRLCCSLGLSIKTHSIYRLHEISISFSPFDEQRRIASSFRLIALAHSKRIECFCSRWSTTSSFQLNKRTNELFTSLLPPSHTATYSTLQRKILWWRSQFSLLPSCLLLLKWIIYSFNYEHFFHLWTSLFDSRTAFEWIKIDDYRRFQLSQCEWHLCVSHRCLLRSLTVYYRWFFIVLLWFGWPMHDPDCWLATT